MIVLAAILVLVVDFDNAAYNKSIKILSNTIKKFIENNKQQRPELNFLSFVEDSPFKIGKTNVGSHSHMLSTTSAMNPEDRYTKRAAPREEPYKHIRDVLGRRGIVKLK